MDVRFAPKADREEDASPRPLCAISGCEQSQQIASYSITSSARASSVSGNIPVDRRGVTSENLGLTSHKSSCNCSGCGMLRAGVCINCAEKIAALIFESGPEELAVEPCSGACREAIELYFSTPPECWHAPLPPHRP